MVPAASLHGKEYGVFFFLTPLPSNVYRPPPPPAAVCCGRFLTDETVERKKKKKHNITPVLRCGDLGRGRPNEGGGAVRAVQLLDGHAVVPHRHLLLHDAPVVVLVDGVHGCANGERA